MTKPKRSISWANWKKRDRRLSGRSEKTGTWYLSGTDRQSYQSAWSLYLQQRQRRGCLFTKKWTRNCQKLRT